MNIFQKHLEELKSGLAAALPGVMVNRSLIDHAELKREELLRGVVTVLLEKIKPADDWVSSMQILITGQVEVLPAVPREATGAVVEAAEAALFGKVRAYLRNTGGLPNITVEEVLFSAQSKVPYGWFLLRCRYGPVGEACTDWDADEEGIPDDIYPPTVVVSDFNGADVKIDVKPHESREEHNKWIAGDFSASVPDAELTVETNNGRKNTETP